LFFGQFQYLLAFGAAAAVIFFPAFFTLDEKHVTTFVGAVHMCVGRLAALVTYGDNIVGDTLAETFIEHKVLTDEFAFQSFSLSVLHN